MMTVRLALPLLTAALLMGESGIAVHGHRGARALRPENTLPAFEYAIAQGVDVLEMDVAITRDEVPVISHDPRINPAICTGPREHVPIHELTLAELRQYDCGSKRHPDYAQQQPAPGTRIPTLDEVLALSSKGSFDFNIETKIFEKYPALTPSPERFAELVLAVIRKHRLEKRVIIQSFDFRTLHVMEKLAPSIRRSALYEGEPRDFAAIAREARASIVSPRYTLVTKAQVGAAHAAGLQVVPWTPNKPEEWRKLIDDGVDAIITDDPAALIRYLREQGRR